MPTKPPNGQANSSTYLLTFDLADDSQVKAWKVAQELAAERKLKQILIGLLVAIYTVQEITRKRIDLAEFVSSFVTGMIVGGNVHNRVAITSDTAPDELPTMFAGTLDHADPIEARMAFSEGMGNLFDEDEEDLWCSA